MKKLTLVVVVYNECVDALKRWVSLGITSYPYEYDIIYVNNNNNVIASDDLIQGSNSLLDISGFLEGLDCSEDTSWYIFFNDTVLRSHRYIIILQRLLSLVNGLETKLPVLAGVIDRNNIISNDVCHMSGYIRTNIFAVNFAASKLMENAANFPIDSEKFKLFFDLHCGFENPFYAHPEFSKSIVSNSLKIKKTKTLFFEQRITNKVSETGYVVGIQRGIIDKINIILHGHMLFLKNSLSNVINSIKNL